MIHLGCCAFNFGDYPLEDSLRLVHELGFHFADVGLGQIDLRVALTEPEQEARRVGQLAERHKLQLVEFFVCAVPVDGEGVAPNEPAPGLRARMLEQFRAICRFAAAAGFDSVMGVPGRPRDELGERGSWETSVETLNTMVSIAGDEGIRFNIEPHKDSIVEKPQDALRLAREVEGLTYTLDYAHFAGQGIPQKDAMALHEFTAHMHGKQARRGYMKSFFHTGTIDFEPILRDLTRRQWDGVIAMECMGGASDDPDVPEPAYREVSIEWEVLGPEPGLVSRPAIQTAVLAYEIERTLERIG